MGARGHGWTGDECECNSTNTDEETLCCKAAGYMDARNALLGLLMEADVC